MVLKKTFKNDDDEQTSDNRKWVDARAISILLAHLWDFLLMSAKTNNKNMGDKEQVVNATC